MSEDLGPSLDEYLQVDISGSDYGVLARPEVSSSSVVLSAIEHFRASPNVSIQVLENVLKIEHHPKLFAQLHSHGMIPACIAAIGKCHQSRELLSCAYGYLAFRILCLVLDSSLHVEMPLIVARKETDTCDILTKNIATYVVLCIESKRPFLVWKSRSKLSEPEIFSFAGGLTIDEARYLLKTLFAGRKYLLHLALQSRLPRLSNVLVIFWQMMMSQKDELLWECLDDLQHRNYIVAPECDRILARTFSKAFFGRLTSANFSVCADHQDAENLLDVFRRNLRLIDPECSMPSLLWVTNSATIQKDRTRYAPQLINITRDLLALMIQVHHYGPDGMPSTVQLGTTLARRIGSYFREAAFKGQASRALIERIIAESEVIGLGGQVYLQGMEHKLVSLTGRWLQSTQISNKFHSEMSNALHSISGAVSEMDSIMRTLPTVVTSMTPQLVLAHIDWSRIQLQTEVLSALYNVQSDVYRTHHIPWAHFGSALGFDLLSSRKCAYPRCFNDRPIPYSLLMACSSCQGAYYCSTTCQRCDWLLDAPLSHRQRCAEVKVEY